MWKGVTPVCESLLSGAKMGPRIREDNGWSGGGGRVSNPPLRIVDDVGFESIVGSHFV